MSVLLVVAVRWENPKAAPPVVALHPPNSLLADCVLRKTNPAMEVERKPKRPRMPAERSLCVAAAV